MSSQLVPGGEPPPPGPPAESPHIDPESPQLVPEDTLSPINTVLMELGDGKRIVTLCARALCVFLAFSASASASASASQSHSVTQFVSLFTAQPFIG